MLRYLICFTPDDSRHCSAAVERQTRCKQASHASHAQSGGRGHLPVVLQQQTNTAATRPNPDCCDCRPLPASERRNFSAGKQVTMTKTSQYHRRCRHTFPSPTRAHPPRQRQKSRSRREWGTPRPCCRRWRGRSSSCFRGCSLGVRAGRVRAAGAQEEWLVKGTKRVKGQTCRRHGHRPGLALRGGARVRAGHGRQGGGRAGVTYGGSGQGDRRDYCAEEDQEEKMRAHYGGDAIDVWWRRYLNVWW
jgi:hypothetical protein